MGIFTRGMSTSCTSIKEMLLKCVRKTPCADRGGTVKECLEDPSLPEECASIKRMFFECRRGQLDMRNRIRGNRWGDGSEAGE